VFLTSAAVAARTLPPACVFGPTCGDAAVLGKSITVIKRRRLTALPVSALLLGGCAVGPNFSPPKAPDVDRYTAEPTASPNADPKGPKVAQQHFVTGGTVAAKWWAAFHSQPLNDLIRLSVEHNPSLQSAEAAIRVAQYNALAQRGLFFPQVGANYTPSYNLQSALDPNSNIYTPFGLHTVQLNVSYVPDVWGSNLRSVENLDATSENQLFQLEAAYLALTANVVTAAVQEASLRGQIDATHVIIKVERDVLDILKSQKSYGQAAELDVYTQEAALAQVEQTLPPLEKQLVVQRDLLTALAGQFSADEILQKFTLKSLALPTNLPVTVPSTLVRQRPDVRAAESSMHAAAALVGVAIAARLPNVVLSANPGYAAVNTAALFMPATGFYTVAASISAPIFDGFTLYHKQKAAEAGLDQADATYRQTVITAIQNVADAIKSLQTDGRAMQAAVKSEVAAKASLDITIKQLKEGLVNQVTVLTAQQTYFTALIARVQAEANRLSDTAALFMALGGGWANDCKTPDWRACAMGDPPLPAPLQTADAAPMLFTPPK
jgi:NodT family efflux transporter outer membrane factor (OMF) lipoprotein